MKKETLTQARFLKVFLPIFIVTIAIAIWQRGYQFGQWLYGMIN